MWDIDKSFPPIEGTKLAVLFSGGVESTLIASIAIDRYGKDNCLLLWTDSTFCNDYPTMMEAIQYNVSHTANHLKMPVYYYDVDYKLFQTDRVTATREGFMRAQESLGFTHIAMGMTAMFWDLRPCQGLTKQQITDHCNTDRVKHHNLIEQFHVDTGVYTEHIDMSIPKEVYESLDIELGNRFYFPFTDLHKQQIIELYHTLGKQDLLYKTISCMSLVNNIHCGECWDCQNRYDAHDIAGIYDRTEYSSDLIKRHRRNLK